MIANRQVVLVVSGQEFWTTYTVLESTNWLLNPKTAENVVRSEFSTSADESSATSPLRVSLYALGLDLDPDLFRVGYHFFGVSSTIDLITIFSIVDMFEFRSIP
jgi:hypothetical protein